MPRDPGRRTIQNLAAAKQVWRTLAKQDPSELAGPARMTVQIRQARPADHDAIGDLILSAFDESENAEIAELVDGLLGDPTAEPCLSLVAAKDRRVVGHVLFTAVRIDGAPAAIKAAILAPLAVHSDHQNQGIGGRLITEGLRLLGDAGTALVFVLGHPGYYPRLGFEPAGPNKLAAPFAIAPENADAWMVRALQPDMLGRIRGTVRCADALNHARYWSA